MAQQLNGKITAQRPVSVFSDSGYNEKSCKAMGRENCKILGTVKPGTSFKITSPPITLYDENGKYVDYAYIESAEVSGYVRVDQTNLYSPDEVTRGTDPKKVVRTVTPEEVTRASDPNIKNPPALTENKKSTLSAGTTKCVDCAKPSNKTEPASQIEKLIEVLLGLDYDPNEMPEEDRIRIKKIQEKREAKERAINEISKVIEEQLSCLSTKAKPAAEASMGLSRGFSGYNHLLRDTVNSLHRAGKIKFENFTRDQLLAADAWARTLFGEMGTSPHKCHSEKYGLYYYKIVARVGMNRLYHARTCINSPFAGPNLTCKKREQVVPFILGADRQFSMFNHFDPQFKVITCIDLEKYPQNKQAWKDAIRVAAEAVIFPEKIRDATGGDKFPYLHYTSAVHPRWANARRRWHEAPAPIIDGKRHNNPKCARLWQGPAISCEKLDQPCDG